MLYLFKVEALCLIYLVLHVKCRSGPLLEGGQGCSPFAYGYLTISVVYVSIANGGIMLLGVTYGTASWLRIRTMIIQEGTRYPVQLEMASNSWHCLQRVA